MGQLVLYSPGQTLHQMEAIRHLQCSRRSAIPTFRIHAVTIPTDDRNPRMLSEPILKGSRASDPAASQKSSKSHQDRSVILPLSPGPLVHSDDRKIGPTGRRDCTQRFSRRNSAFRPTGIPDRRLKRSPARPPKAWGTAWPTSPNALSVVHAWERHKASAGKRSSWATSIATTPATYAHCQFH